MTYQELLQHIFALGRFGIKPGLERIRALLAALGNPQDAFRVIHVAGTNGKGSTASFIASILAAGGYRTGLFTSPHLVSFTERFRVNGDDAEEDELVVLAERVLAAAPAGTTFFEIVTALAVLCFAERKVDCAVLEAGMGGGLDATNAIAGILTVISPVSLDHCEYLGDTLTAIALEKSGIIKAGFPVVVSRQAPEVLAVIERKAVECSSAMYCSGRDFTARWQAGSLSYQGLDRSLEGLAPGIGGSYQADNAACALAAAELLDRSGFTLPEKAFRQGIETARWPGRMEFFPGPPRILLDGAHNPAGSAALAEELQHIPYRRILLVVGVMGDKDLVGILGPLAELADLAIAVEPPLERACPSAQLAGFFAAIGVECLDAGSVAAGLTKAISAAGPDDLVVVCGSLFTVGAARAFLTTTDYKPFRG